MNVEARLRRLEQASQGPQQVVVWERYPGETEQNVERCYEAAPEGALVVVLRRFSRPRKPE